jgi:hypothetical protein
MGWIWTVIPVVWLIIGFKRIPVYYKRCDEYNAEHFPYTHKDNGMQVSAATGTVALAVFWPFYEAGLWVLNYIIRTATAEQRKWDEYVKAEQIVEAYKKQKEREEKEAFDRELGKP